MNERPTKNFYFDESVEMNFYDKDKFHKNLFEVEKYLRNKSYDDIPNKIRKMFEEIMSNIIEDNKIPINVKNLHNLHHRSFSLKDKIYAICNHFSLNSEIKTSMLTLNNYCNLHSHHSEINNSVDYYEILTILKNFHIFVFQFIKMQNNDKYIEIDIFFEDLYTINKLENTQIISDEEYALNKAMSNQFKQDVCVKDINLYHFIFKNKRRFIIPMYQRGYTWTKENIEDLFSDILNRMNDGTTHYFGVIAGKLNHTTSNNEVVEIKIIDGQQRLTTSVLVVMACYYVLEELNVENLNSTFDDIFNCLGTSDEFGNLFKNPGCRGNENDVFRSILELRWKNNIESHVKYSTNLSKLIMLIKEKFADDSNSIKEFMDCFLSYFTIAMVDFNANTISIKKELEIFENLNSKGKSLNLSELVKNYIFNLCDEQTLNEKQSEVEGHFELKINAEMTRYTNDAEKIEEYLTNFYSYLTNYFKGEESKGSKNQNILLKDFKEYVIETILKKLNLTNKMINLSDYKKVVNKISEFLVKGFLPIKYNDFVNREIYILDFINSISDKKKPLIYSLSFLIAEKFNKISDLSKKEKKIIFKCYEYLIKIITFHFLIIGKGDSDLKRNIYSKISQIRENLNSVCTIEEIYYGVKEKITLSELLGDINISKEKLKQKIIETNGDKKGNSWSKILLLLISYYLSRDMGDPENINKDISLEHIMPQELTHSWISDIRKWNKLDERESEKEIKEKCVTYQYQLGNYLITTKDLNSKLKNKDFSKKIEILNNQNFVQNLMRNKISQINVLDKEIWSFEVIESRSEALADIVVELMDN